MEGKSSSSRWAARKRREFCDPAWRWALTAPSICSMQNSKALTNSRQLRHWRRPSKRMAEFLASAHATVVVGVEASGDGKSLKVRRELEGGINETVELGMPAVLTIQFGINQPRYASLKGIMAAKKKE